MTLSRRLVVAVVLSAAPAAALVGAGPARGAGAAGLRFAVSFPASLEPSPQDGRVILILSKDHSAEPRFQVSDTSLKTQQVFGVDAEGLSPGQDAVFDASVLGYPLPSLAEVPAGTYRVQAVLHKYETFRLGDGRVLKLPMDRGEGQQWNRAPGNLYSTPLVVAIDPSKPETLRITLDKVIPAIPDPPTTRYIRHERIRSERLSKFWGRDMYLGAHVLVPWGFDEHPGARFPLVIYHGHFPETFDGFREEPPDPDLKPDFSERFQWPGYNRTQQELAHQFFLDWTSPSYPRMLIVQIQHANPYYDDSYAVNSANIGPYGDAITYELIPYLERKYRAIGAGWARFLYGGSTGGWESLAAQVFYPDEYNGCFAACPDPIDFRAYTVVDVYEDQNAFFFEGPWKRVPRPGHRDDLGHLSATLEQMNRLELVLGSKGRSGGQWDVWEAVYSPVGSDGYPARIWDRKSGVIDKRVAEYWRNNYDLSAILRRDWETGLGQKLAGKIHLYVGDMDNYYLNNAVYLTEDFLKRTTNPPYAGEVAYGDRAEHCWNGDPTRPNALSRLRYHQMFAPRIVERLLKTAPPGGDVTSWRY